MATSLEILKK